jgi:hypothetical protein
MKGLKARKIIAQGKASLRATPWVRVPQNNSLSSSNEERAGVRSRESFEPLINADGR